MIGDLRDMSVYVFNRTRERVAGLSDEEYLWEPVPGCWSVRTTRSGRPALDAAADPGRTPFTTIAWRLWHLTACYGDARNGLWLTGYDDGRGDERCAPRITAVDALAALEAGAAYWHALLAGLDDDHLNQPLGPAAGPFAGSGKASFVLHQLDEMVHHGAEVALLRDLYRDWPAAG